MIGLLLLLALPQAELTYAVVRNGNEIGEHKVRMSSTGTRVLVDHHVKIRVGLGDVITIYRYELRSRIIYIDGKLMRIDCKTNQNGRKLQVRGQRTKAGVEVRTSRRDKLMGSKSLIPTGPHLPIVNDATKQMIDCQDGNIYDVQVSGPTRDRIKVRGKPVEAERYEIRGDMEQTIWYDDHGMLLRKKLKGYDGSSVEELLR